MTAQYERLLRIPSRSFFLFGPRGVGKSYWLRQRMQAAAVLDLLQTGLQLELTRQPGLLEARLGRLPAGAWVWIDEVQKVPALLDEVHRLMENRGLRFALSGSSARKLLRQGADLLAGRAITRRMESLCSAELGGDFAIDEVIDWGTLPLVVKQREHAADTLAAYVHTYIREEIREEGLVRKLEPFLRFLDVAGLMNGQTLNTENIAREARVPRKSVVSYFSILEDTLMGHLLPAWRPGARVREVSHPKFYWFDPGVARAAAGLTFDKLDAVWRGYALETMLFHELRVYNHMAARERPIYYYRTRAGLEIDFIIELERKTMTRKPLVIALEVKLSKKWRRDWEVPMRALKESGEARIEHMYGLYLGDTSYRFGDIDVLPVEEFLKRLFEGKVF